MTTAVWGVILPRLTIPLNVALGLMLRIARRVVTAMIVAPLDTPKTYARSNSAPPSLTTLEQVWVIVVAPAAAATLVIS